jgi:hypothetical protein
VKGSYQITVKAKDTSGAESAWSDPLGVSMPTSKNTLRSTLLIILEWLFHRFPFLEKLLVSLGLFST